MILRDESMLIWINISQIGIIDKASSEGPTIYLNEYYPILIQINLNPEANYIFKFYSVVILIEPIHKFNNIA